MNDTNIIHFDQGFRDIKERALLPLEVGILSSVCVSGKLIAWLWSLFDLMVCLCFACTLL